jgi:hypothetical protein
VYRDKEIVPAFNPCGFIPAQSPSGNNAVQMWMVK